MALFFDAGWFDAELARLHLSRADLGRMLGLDAAQVAELWKDQRELKPDDVALIAALFNRAPEVVADHAGISTRVAPVQDAGIASFDKRLTILEQKLDRMLTLVEALVARSGPNG